MGSSRRAKRGDSFRGFPSRPDQKRSCSELITLALQLVRRENGKEILDWSECHSNQFSPFKNRGQQHRCVRFSHPAARNQTDGCRPIKGGTAPIVAIQTSGTIFPKRSFMARRQMAGSGGNRSSARTAQRARSGRHVAPTLRCYFSIQWSLICCQVPSARIAAIPAFSRVRSSARLPFGTATASGSSRNIFGDRIIWPG